MPDTARILRFPAKPKQIGLSSQEAGTAARDYLRTPLSERTAETQQVLHESDVILAMCLLLREEFDRNPSIAVEEAARLHEWIAAPDRAIGVFDERQYFLGETALIAGIGCRLLGRREQSGRWLDRAEAGFRHTVNPAPYLANVTHARLALFYEMRQYDHVFDLLPSLAASFENLNMGRELARCHYLEAMALKECGRLGEASARLLSLIENPQVSSDSTILGLALVNLGDVESEAGRFNEAMACYQRALPVVQNGGKPIVLAQLKSAIGTTLKQQNNFAASVEAYQEAICEFSQLEMRAEVAYLRVLKSEVLVAIGRHREAEWEILAALPTIEEEKMVPEGFVAVGLLREAIRSRKSDPAALRELREHLQAKS